MAPHSSTLAWKIPWTEEPGRLQSMGSLGVGHDQRLHFHFSLSYTGEGNGNPLQCSCLENPRDGGAWWAAVSGVAQSQTLLKRLSSSSSSLYYGYVRCYHQGKLGEVYMEIVILQIFCKPTVSSNQQVKKINKIMTMKYTFSVLSSISSANFWRNAKTNLLYCSHTNNRLRSKNL